MADPTAGQEGAATAAGEPVKGSVAESVPPTGRTGTRRRARLRLVVRLGFIALVAVFAAVAIQQRWSQVRSGFLRLDVAHVALATTCALLSLVPALLAWRELLAGLGSRLPLRAAAKVFFVGQLGKYLPGSVWPVLAQMELARAHRVPRPQTAAAGLVAIGTGVVGALLVAGACLPFAVRSEQAQVLLLLGLGVSLVLASPAVLNALVRIGLRVLRRPALATRLTLRTIAAAVMLSALSWVLQGLAADVLARALGGHGWRLLALAIGATASASALGILVVIAPAGLGVRDPALVAALSSVLEPGAALVVAIGVRLLLSLADLGVGFAAGLLGGRPGSREMGLDEDDPPTGGGPTVHVLS